MHYPLTDIQADFEINRLIRYQVTVKRNYLHKQTDGRTERQTSSMTTIGSFFEKKTTKKSIFLDMHHHKTYMYINFQENEVKTQVVTACTCTTP